MCSDDTIAAIATASGSGGIGIVRVSGPLSQIIAENILGFSPTPRYAHHCDFKDKNNALIDSGIALFFQAPHSFTGEHVLELQGHGGSVVMQMLLDAALSHGARLANPGEFSERAFLNDKLDLAQAEAIADLINASSEQAARNATNSLQGHFSETINTLEKAIVQLRVYVESAIDFPEEEIDFLQSGHVEENLQDIISKLNNVMSSAKQGALLRDGIHLVIAGRPNAGKSSLLNQLAGSESAIVTDIAGTTRDLIHEKILVDGVPFHITDTAGLRDSDDQVEQLGIDRSFQQIKKADHVLLVIDTTDAEQTSADFQWRDMLNDQSQDLDLTIIANKIDKKESRSLVWQASETAEVIELSASTGQGIEGLRNHLRKIGGINNSPEGNFTARQRHIDALRRCKTFAESATHLLYAGELLAEDLRQAHDALGEITGTMLPDELLGEIFTSFCIGK